MISVLLIILKIIGITLLVIVGLVLLLLLLVLFVPVRYKAEGEYNESFRCKAKVSWLLRLISVKVDVAEEVTTSVRILGIPLSVFLKSKEKTDADDETDKTIANTEKSEEVMKGTLSETASKTTNEVVSEETQAPKVENADGETVEEQTQKFEVGAEEKKSFFDKISDRIRAIIEKVKDILDKIRNIFIKIKDFLANLEGKKKTIKRYLRILKSDMVKAAFAVCKKRLYIMLKHVLPRKMLVNVHYGLEDPANTGYILGVYGVLPTFIGERIVLHPDFENVVFKCDFRMKGAIRMWTLIYQLLCVIFDENCRKLYYVVKKESANEPK